MADETTPLLPELARSLRVLGTPNDAASEAAHAAIFGPLLGARARAARSDAEGALTAFKGEVLINRILAHVHSAAVGGFIEPARGRARDAAARELLNPLLASLTELDRIAMTIPVAAATTSEPWTRWVDQLRVVFSAADAACGGLASLLSEPAEAPSARRWFGRSSEEDGR